MDGYATGVNSGLGNLTSKQAESGSPIRDRISAAESWLSDLHMAVDNLEKRLDTVLAPVPPANPSTTAVQPPQRPQSHVQGRLEILNDGFAHLCARLNHLHLRIEL